jgi:hypothetical protein
MDLSELNKEMFALQNDFQHHQYKPDSQQKNTNTNTNYANQFSNSQDVNFQPIKDTIDTTQIKRPTKSGEHRNDINEKMNMLNSTYFEPESYNTQSQSPDMINKQTQSYQSTRNNSNYVNNINNLQTSQSRNPQKEPTNQTNNFANYYNNNFATLQTNNNTHMRYSNLDSSLDNSPENLYDLQYNQMNSNNNINSSNSTQNTHTHNNGISMLNVRNMYSLNDFSQESTLNNSNKINDTGYHRIEEKKTDYRQNINNKLDNMIFDNPSAMASSHPILQQRNSNGNSNHLQKDTRMVIQDSNKDYYRQSANERMSQYSPLSRSSNIPIHMANMSVNDFYGNMNMNPELDKKIIEEEHNKLNSKEMLNNRLNNYTPLAKTVQYESNQSQQNNIQSNQLKQPQPNNIQSKQSNQSNQSKQSKQSNQSKQLQPNNIQPPNIQSRQHMKPQQWNPLDVNSKLQNVVYNQLPVISNSERI